MENDPSDATLLHFATSAGGIEPISSAPFSHRI